MLFRKKIEPSCSYCKYGSEMGYEEVACSKRGIMESSGECGAFKYEPTKRIPEYAKTPAILKIEESELSF